MRPLPVISLVAHPLTFFVLFFFCALWRFSSSQAILAWLSDGFLVSAEATPVLSDGAAGDIHIDDKDIRSLLGWRWTNPWSRTASPAGSGAVLTASPTVSTAQSGLLPSSTLSTINSSTTRSSQTPPLDSGLRCVAKVCIVSSHHSSPRLTVFLFSHSLRTLLLLSPPSCT